MTETREEIWARIAAWEAERARKVKIWQAEYEAIAVEIAEQKAKESAVIAEIARVANAKADAEESPAMLEEINWEDQEDCESCKL